MYVLVHPCCPCCRKALRWMCMKLRRSIFEAKNHVLNPPQLLTLLTRVVPKQTSSALSTSLLEEEAVNIS
eukprot:746335-Hanusia_phi.AAC.1